MNKYPKKKHFIRKGVTSLLFVVYLLMSINVPAYAKFPFETPSLSSKLMQKGQRYNPVVLRGLKINRNNPFSFNFIVDHGDSHPPADELKKITTKGIKYFLAALTIPKDRLWVNLSPYDHDRIIDEYFGWTEMGRDMLAVDYLLKKLSSSLTYPETDLGGEFWEKIYKQAYEQYQVTNIDFDTFSRVWIVPDKVHIYKNGESAFILDAKMKVLLEQDYLSLEKNLNSAHKNDLKNETDLYEINSISSKIARKIILPVLEEEINKSKHFATLRQMYHALILATWYKKDFEKTYISKSYANQQKVDGIKLDNRKKNAEIYKQYLKTLKDGIYNYIKEDYDPIGEKIIPRKYFSGGTNFEKIDQAMIAENRTEISKHLKQSPTNFSSVNYDLLPIFISSNHKGSNRGVHRTINKKAKIIISKIGKEIEANFDEARQMYDIRGMVEKNGGEIITRTGKLRINPDDNMLEIMDLRFEGGHAGLGAWAVYAEDEGYIVHEKTELMSWAKFAARVGLIDYADIKNLDPKGSYNDHNLRTLLESWLYLTADSEEEALIRKNLIHKLGDDFHHQAVEAEKKYRETHELSQQEKQNRAQKKNAIAQSKTASNQHGEEVVTFIEGMPSALLSYEQKESIIRLLADITTYKMDLEEVKTLTQLFLSPFLLENGWSLIEEYINVAGMHEYFTIVNPLQDTSIIGMIGEIMSADAFKNGDLLKDILPGKIEIKSFGVKGKTDFKRLLSRFALLEKPRLEAEFFNQELKNTDGEKIIRKLAQTYGRDLKKVTQVNDEFKKYFPDYTDTMFQAIENVLLQNKTFTMSQISTIFKILKENNHIDNSKILLSINEKFSQVSQKSRNDLSLAGLGKYEIQRIEKTLKKLSELMDSVREFDVIIHSQQTGTIAIVESKYFNFTNRPEESEGISYLYPWYVSNPLSSVEDMKGTMQRQMEMYLQLVLLPGMISFKNKSMNDFINFEKEIKYLFSVIGLIRNEEERKTIEKYIQKDINEIISNFKEDNPEFRDTDLTIRPTLISIPEKKDSIRWEKSVEKTEIEKQKGDPLTKKHLKGENLNISDVIIGELQKLGYIFSVENDSYAINLNFTDLKSGEIYGLNPDEIDAINSLLDNHLKTQGTYYQIEAYYKSFRYTRTDDSKEDLQSKISNLLKFDAPFSLNSKTFQKIDSWPASILLEALLDNSEYKFRDSTQVIKEFIDKLGLDFLQRILIEHCYDNSVPRKWTGGALKKIKKRQLIEYINNAIKVVEKVSLEGKIPSTDFSPMAKINQDFLKSIVRNHKNIIILTEGGEDYVAFIPSREDKLTEVVVAGENTIDPVMLINDAQNKNVGGVDFNPDYMEWKIDEKFYQNMNSDFSSDFFNNIKTPNEIKGYFPVYVGAENLLIKDIPILLGIEVFH